MSRIARLVQAALWGLGLGSLAVDPVGLARADGALPGEHLARFERGQQLLRSEEYADALKEFAAAYALRQTPPLLYYQGLAHQKLGHFREAMEFYRRYLVASGSEPENAQERQAVINRIEELNRISALTAPPVPPQSMALLPYRVETREHHRGMVAAGWTLLSVGYAFAFGTGIAFTVIGRDQQAAAGGTLLIPVVGPLVSSAVWYDAVLYWGLPWLLTDLPLQVSGLALLVQGYRTRQRVVVPNLRELTETRLRPYVSPDGVGMIAIGRF